MPTIQTLGMQTAQHICGSDDLPPIPKSSKDITDVNDITKTYVNDIVSGQKDIQTAVFDFSNSMSNSVDIARLMFILQTLFRESQSVEATCVISELEANVESLLNQAQITIDTAKDVYSEKMDAAKWKMAAGAMTIAAGVLSLGAMGVTANATSNLNFAGGVGQGVSSAFSGSGSMIGAKGEMESAKAEQTQHEGEAAKKEEEALANRAQADKQRAEMWENHFAQLVQELLQLAKTLLEEVTNSLRTVGRNI